MKKAKLVLSAIAILAIIGGAVAFKSSRGELRFYEVNTTTTVTADKLCTKPTFVEYTTVFNDRVPGSPTIVQNQYYTTAVASTICPTTTIWLHD